MGTPYNFRSWLDQPLMDPNTNLLTEEYARGIQEFMGVVQSQPEARTSKYLLCPCSTCKNNIRVKKMEVWSHLYLKGFTRGYKIWYLHGERFEYGSSSEPQTADRLDEPTTDVDFGLGIVQMVYDAYGENLPSGEEEGDRQEQPNVENFPCEEEGEREQPNLEARRFFEMLDAAKQPLYQGCKDGHSPLSSASRLMALKTDYNLAEECVDAIADFVKDVLPEDNLAPGSYYEVQKLVAGLGLPYQVIDVCIDNCMIYWRADENRENCKFCQKPRYQDTSGRVPVPYKRMWYLPLTERLKRLYQSERTAEPMRWHAEHLTNGEITHPFDAEAWKHFQSTYPEFTSEERNVYLALCTDGFSPFGKHGRQNLQLTTTFVYATGVFVPLNSRSRARSS